MTRASVWRTASLQPARGGCNTERFRPWLVPKVSRAASGAGACGQTRGGQPENRSLGRPAQHRASRPTFQVPPWKMLPPTPSPQPKLLRSGKPGKVEGARSLAHPRPSAPWTGLRADPTPRPPYLSSFWKDWSSAAGPGSGTAAARAAPPSPGHHLRPRRVQARAVPAAAVLGAGLPAAHASAPLSPRPRPPAPSAPGPPGPHGPASPGPPCPRSSPHPHAPRPRSAARATAPCPCRAVKPTAKHLQVWGGSATAHIRGGHYPTPGFHQGHGSLSQQPPHRPPTQPSSGSRTLISLTSRPSGCQAPAGGGV